eukprot:1351989-Amorphochlora_amoeboformis.AAC.1
MKTHWGSFRDCWRPLGDLGRRQRQARVHRRPLPPRESPRISERSEAREFGPAHVNPKGAAVFRGTCTFVCSHPRPNLSGISSPVPSPRFYVSLALGARHFPAGS